MPLYKTILPPGEYNVPEPSELSDQPANVYPDRDGVVLGKYILTYPVLLVSLPYCVLGAPFPPLALNVTYA